MSMPNVSKLSMVRYGWKSSIEQQINKKPRANFVFNFLDNVVTSSAINSCITRTYLSLELLNMDGTLAWHRTYFAPFYISVSLFDVKKIVFYTFIFFVFSFYSVYDDFVDWSGQFQVGVVLTIDQSDFARSRVKSFICLFVERGFVWDLRPHNNF